MLHSIARLSNTAPWPLPTQDDVAAAVQQLKNDRAADSNQLFAELLKAAGSCGVAALHWLVLLAFTGRASCRQ